jgi:proline dehydrogenase
VGAAREEVAVIRRVLLSVSESERIRDTAVAAPVTRDIVTRYVAGEQIPDAVDTTAELVGQGLTATIDRLGEDVNDLAHADQTREDYLQLLAELHAAGLTSDAEVSVKLSAVGQALPGIGHDVALENARAICASAAQAGTNVTIDMEDHTTTDDTLDIVRALREDYPDVGAVLQAYLFRTEQDCRDLAYEGSRVRLCKGAYREPPSVAYTKPHDVDLSFVRCMKVLMHGDGLPMIATHDPRLIQIGRAVAMQADRSKGSYEIQMLLGVRPEEQVRLSDDGETVRVYVPYGEDWYGYMVRRMAEKPGNLGLFMKSLRSKK